MNAHSPHPWASGPGIVHRIPPPEPNAGPVPFVVAVEGAVLDCNISWPEHEHAVHELIWSSQGVVLAESGRDSWALPAHVGAWFPAGVRHSGRAGVGTRFHAAYFNPASFPKVFPSPMMVEVPELLHALLNHLKEPSLGAQHRANAERVVADLITEAPASFQITLPSDPRIARIAEELAQHPGEGRSAAQWAAWAGTSARTVARAFREATGSSFHEWRTSLRMQIALSLLASGMAVQEVALAVGYRTHSAFSAAFRNATGSSPVSYRNSRMRARE